MAICPTPTTRTRTWRSWAAVGRLHMKFHFCSRLSRGRPRACSRVEAESYEPLHTSRALKMLLTMSPVRCAGVGPQRRPRTSACAAHERSTRRAQHPLRSTKKRRFSLAPLSLPKPSEQNRTSGAPSRGRARLIINGYEQYYKMELGVDRGWR